jgi:UDP-N-acetylglucosamine--dolichyl-phosphate N-acetylglucosaminephosphotransferase
MVDTLDVATLTVSLIVSLLTTLITVPWLIRQLAKRDIMGIDQNKLDKTKVPEMGGLAVVIGFVAGISTFLVMNKILKDIEYEFLAATVLAVVGAALAGIMDDLFGLRQRVKAIIPFLFAIPVGVYVADKTTMSFIVVMVDFGILMMLIAPFGVTCAANAGNMLEGFNGLGTGLGIIISVTLIMISLWSGVTDSLILLFPLLGALIAFLWFNRYPARIFPGDTLTLFVGATIACAAIVGDFKTIGAFLFIPMIIEFFLKLRGHFKGENYGTPDEEGYLTHEGDIESLTHYIMKNKKVKERQLVWILWGIEGVLCVIVFILAVAEII